MENNVLLTFTEAASRHFTQMVVKQQDCVGVRISVKKAGCTGLRYVLDYVQTVDGNDEIVEVSPQLTVYVDKKAIPYILGTEVDFVKQGLNGKVKFNNPNEKSSCGCGESFYT